MAHAITDELQPELSQVEQRLVDRLTKALGPQQFEVQVKVWRGCIDLAAELCNVTALSRFVRLVEENQRRGASVYGPRAVYGPVVDSEAVGYADR